MFSAKGGCIEQLCDDGALSNEVLGPEKTKRGQQ